MIKINLALKKTSSASSVEPGTRSGMPKFDGAAMANALKDSPKIKQIVLLIVTVAVGYWLVEDQKAERLAVGDRVLTKIRGDITGIKKALEETKRYDELKKSLQADEIVMRTKLDTIDKLLKDRGTAPRLLTALSGSMPKEVWLSELKVAPGELGIKGQATDFTRVSDFMRGLNESVYFRDASLKSSTQGNGRAESSGKLTAANEYVTFELGVKRR